MLQNSSKCHIRKILGKSYILKINQKTISGYYAKAFCYYAQENWEEVIKIVNVGIASAGEEKDLENLKIKASLFVKDWPKIKKGIEKYN